MTQENNQQVLAQFFWDCGRSGEVEGVFPDGEISGYNPLSYLQETEEDEYEEGEE